MRKERIQKEWLGKTKVNNIRKYKSSVNEEECLVNSTVPGSDPWEKEEEEDQEIPGFQTSSTEHL